jgi:membrane protease YdiL (CAAX protease family)
VRIDAQPVPARALVHQEGVIAAIALIGLAVRDGSPVAGLAPHGNWLEAIVAGTVVTVGVAAALWAVRGSRPLRELERWQRRLVEHWEPADVASVALLSGLAEEALMRALLQPLIGLVPAALVFALLHLVPDRRLWAWPVTAFVMGLVFGWLQQRYGYPAAAAAHVLLNGVSLMRLRRETEPSTSD